VNVHSIISRYVGAINPNLPVTLYRSTGATQNADASRTPTYTLSMFKTSRAWVQVQPMTYGDIQMADALNIQGTREKMWINGQVSGLVRGLQRGGDLVVKPDGTNWKIALVLEAWPDWCSAVMTLQTSEALAYAPLRVA
jgi:hypothetical protein